VKKQLPPPLHPQTSGQGGAPGTTSATEAFVQPSEYVARDEVFKVCELASLIVHGMHALPSRFFKLYCRNPYVMDNDVHVG
jgi:hypothetical protein